MQKTGRSGPLSVGTPQLAKAILLKPLVGTASNLVSAEIGDGLSAVGLFWLGPWGFGVFWLERRCGGSR